MTAIPITGFICALVLALIVIAWIAYCMFCRERHKSVPHYDISDIRKMNYEIAQAQQTESEQKQVEVKAGIFILPSRHKHKNEYEKRPDYPESPVPMPPKTDNLVEIMDDFASVDVHYKDDGICDVESKSQYQSDV